MAVKPTILFVALIPKDYSPYLAASYGMERTFDLLPHKNAVLSLVAWLRENGCDGHYVWINALDEEGKATVEDAIALCEPDAIGFSLVTEEVMSHYEVIRYIKGKRPDLQVIVGGPHATALPEHTLRNFPDIDIVAVGEGERTLTEWLTRVSAGQRGYELGDIAGLGYRLEDGRIIVTEAREKISDINILPDPAYDLIFDPKAPPDERSAYPLVCSYGCYFHCTFCSVEHGHYRNITPEKVVGRMERAKRKYKVEYFAIRDSFWPPSREWLDRFCDEIENRNLKIKFHFQTRAGVLKEKHLGRLKKIGAQAIAIGVEAGDPEILKSIKKGITIDLARGTVKALNKAGIFSIAFFIFGNKGETRETIQRSVDVSHDLNATIAFYHVLFPLPGAECFEAVPDDEKDWWMGRGKGLPSICDLKVSELEKLATEAFIKYPLRWAWIRQHMLGGSLFQEFRNIARKVFTIHLRKYTLGMAERSAVMRSLILKLKSGRPG